MMLCILSVIEENSFLDYSKIDMGARNSGEEVLVLLKLTEVST